MSKTYKMTKHEKLAQTIDRAMIDLRHETNLGLAAELAVRLSNAEIEYRRAVAAALNSLGCRAGA